jgi:molybdopterin converting factor small subunit
MATTVFIPTPLRSYAGNQSQVEVTAMNIHDALQGLVQQHPALREHLFDNDGNLRSFVNIYLNDNDIRYLANEETKVEGNDTISIIPAIAGGATQWM